MNNNDERDYAEEAAARAAYEDEYRAEAEAEAEEQALRAKFWHAVDEADRLQAKAVELGDEADATGGTNEEFQARAEADDMRAQALALAIQIINR